MAIQLICLGRVRYLSNAGMPERLSVSRIVRYQAPRAVAGKDQPARGGEHAPAAPAASIIGMPPRGFPGLIIDRGKEIASRTYIDLFASA